MDPSGAALRGWSAADTERAECVQTGEAARPAMVVEARGERRGRGSRGWGAESDEESDGCNGAQVSARVRVRNTY